MPRKRGTGIWATLLCVAGGCATHPTLDMGPEHDRPFPLGQVTDAHWETQQANAEAADFIFYDHEFVGDTAELAPGAKRHLEQVALRLEHVPFPIVIEQTEYDRNPQLDVLRRKTIVEQLARLGHVNVANRVVVADAFPLGRPPLYSNTRNGNGNNGGGFNNGRRFGGSGGFYR